MGSKFVLMLPLRVGDNWRTLERASCQGGSGVEGLVAGISVGCLIGVITGMMTLLILTDAFPRRTKPSFKERIVALRISALPVSWFGGPWLTTIVMSDLNWKELRGPYLVTLAVVYILIIIVPLVCMVARVSRMVGR